MKIESIKTDTSNDESDEVSCSTSNCKSITIFNINDSTEITDHEIDSSFSHKNATVKQNGEKTVTTESQVSSTTTSNDFKETVKTEIKSDVEDVMDSSSGLLSTVKSEVLSDCDSASSEEMVSHDSLTLVESTHKHKIKKQTEKEEITEGFHSEVSSKEFQLGTELKIHRETHSMMEIDDDSEETVKTEIMSDDEGVVNSSSELLSSAKFKVLSDCDSASSEEMVSHKIKEEEEEITGSFQCEVCSKEFQLETELKLHRETHSMTEINYDNFDIYIEQRSGELPFQCRICGKGFTRKQTAKHHHVIHTGQKPHVCHICQKAFRHRSALYKHKRSHSALEPAKHACTVCGKLFKHKSYLSIHAVIHTEERPYVCDICGSTFKDRSARNKHVQAHSGIKPYSCEICGKCFGRKGDYKSHQVIHTEERPYVCSVCGRGFRSSSNCRRHSRIHTNNYPYKCDVCDKAFNQNWKLKEHKYTHTDELPYSCQFCDAAFRYSRKLKRHVEEHMRERLHSQVSTNEEQEECLFEVIDVQPDISALIE